MCVSPSGAHNVQGVWRGLPLVPFAADDDHVRRVVEVVLERLQVLANSSSSMISRWTSASVVYRSVIRRSEMTNFSRSMYACCQNGSDFDLPNKLLRRLPITYATTHG